MWNLILKDQSGSSGLQNKNLLVFGRKNVGKRTLIDSLSECSKTVYPKKCNKNFNLFNPKLFRISCQAN
jgi:hypothetical protein